MKRILLGAILLFSVISCDGIDSKDKLISTVLKIETRHLKIYNNIQTSSKDVATVEYINKLKDSLKIEAIEAKSVLKSSSGIMHGSLTESKNMLEDYIKLCDNRK